MLWGKGGPAPKNGVIPQENESEGANPVALRLDLPAKTLDAEVLGCAQVPCVTKKPCGNMTKREYHMNHRLFH